MKYVIHHKAVNQCLELGMKNTATQKGLKFEETPWMKKYIDLNTDLRARAKSKFEQDFYKLMNNSVYGKMMGNFRNNFNIKLGSTKAAACDYSAAPNCHNRLIFDEHLSLYTCEAPVYSAINCCTSMDVY